VTAAAAGSFRLGGEVSVNRLGFGAMWMPGPDGGSAVLRRAVELGVNLIDTADVYGHGASEAAIADALHPYPADLVIATKGGQISVGGEPAANGRPEHLRAACEESLRRLRMETIPLYQLHNPDPGVPIRESIGALADLRAEGKVRQIGVSNVGGDELRQLLDEFPIVSVQNLYNADDRRGDEDVDLCTARGVAFIPYRPLASGALAEQEASRGATAAQVALAWLLQRSPAMVPIPGTTSVRHLEENVGAGSLRLQAS
jgi:aryl-alcohol dehydrogenase-like predicted oxidoreductase